jgi:hypothetical protein
VDVDIIGIIGKTGWDRPFEDLGFHAKLEVLMKTRCIAVLLGSAVLVFGPSNAVFAHHSHSYYAVETKILKGTVVQFYFRNPHAMVIWDVKDDSGNVVRWAGELSSVTTLMGDGLTKNSLKAGDEIIFAVRPTKVGTPQAAIQSMKRPDGSWVLQWSTQSEVGLTEEEVARARKAVGLPELSPLRGGSNRVDVK